MKNAKVDNSHLPSKVVLRQWALEKMGGAINCKVLELFGGEGHMHDACYLNVKKHLAFDIKPIDRPTWIKGDNRLLLPKNVQGWDLYDVDAYGTAWPLIEEIHRLRHPGRYALTVTDGMRRGLNGANLVPHVAKTVGLPKHMLHPLMAWFYADIVRAVVRSWYAYGVKVEAAVMTPPPNASSVHYFAFICRKD